MKRPPISEREFQAQVKELALWNGWLVYHTFDSRRSDAGFPDLVLVRGQRLIFAELKSAKGRVTAEQQQWIDTLKGALQCSGYLQAHVWRPADWDEIEQLLRR